VLGDWRTEVPDPACFGDTRVSGLVRERQGLFSAEAKVANIQ